MTTGKSVVSQPEGGGGFVGNNPFTVWLRVGISVSSIKIFSSFWVQPNQNKAENKVMSTQAVLEKRGFGPDVKRRMVKIL